MTSFKQISCRLCLEIMKDTHYEVIDNRTKNILDALLQLNLDEESKQVICGVCSERLNAALEFKTMCINTDNIIIAYTDSKILQFDLRQVYILKNGLVNIGYDQKICRLCLQVVPNEFRHIHKTELEHIQKLVPEMNITITKDSIICKSCFDSLYVHNTFLNNCATVEKGIKNICSHSDIERCREICSDLFVKKENFEEEFENELEMSIKSECVEIKSEGEEDEGNNHQLSDLSTSNDKIFKCDLCEYTGKYSTSILVHKLLKHDNELKMLKRNIREITDKQNLKRQSKRKFCSKKCYKCTVCGYETKNKRDLKRHEFNHNSEAPTYQCAFCEFETKYKKHLRTHQSNHKISWHRGLFKCTECSFQTEERHLIGYHGLIHKATSGVADGEA